MSIFIVKVTPIKLEQIWPKNTFLKKKTVTQNRAPNSSIRALIFVELLASTGSQNRAQTP